MPATAVPEFWIVNLAGNDVVEVCRAPIRRSYASVSHVGRDGNSEA